MKVLSSSTENIQNTVYGKYLLQIEFLYSYDGECGIRVDIM